MIGCGAGALQIDKFWSRFGASVVWAPCIPVIRGGGGSFPMGVHGAFDSVGLVCGSRMGRAKASLIYFFGAEISLSIFVLNSCGGFIIGAFGRRSRMQLNSERL